MSPFFDYFDQVTDNLVRILTNGTGLNSNIDGKSFTQKLKHNTQVNITLAKRPIGIIVLKKNPTSSGGQDSPSIVSFDWQANKDETIGLKIKLDDTTFQDTIEVTFYAYFS